MPLLHGDCPAWLQVHITTALATLPLRPDGVKQFILYRAQSSGSQVADGQTHSTAAAAFPAVPLDVLQIIAKLLSSTPKALSPNQYFQGIAPQLLELLDEEDDEARRVASFVIASGILSKRAIGASGSIGWKLFVEPIHAILNPNLATNSSEHDTVRETNSSNSIPILSTNEDVQRAVRRLACLTLIHPNPPVTQRLLRPLMLPLWGLACRSTERAESVAMREKCLVMVSVYLKFASGTTAFVELIDQLLFKGTKQWTYHVGLEDIEIRRREADQFLETAPEELLQTVNSRVLTYLKLLEFCDVNDNELGELFAYVASRWLRPYQARAQNPLFVTDAEDPRYGLVYTSLTQEMIKTYETRISRQPDRILNLLNDILDDIIREPKSQDTSTSKPSLSKLHSIVAQKPVQTLNGMSEPEEDSNEILEISLSLLSTIFSSPDFTPSNPNIRSSLTSTLESITTNSLHAIPPSIPAMVHRLLDTLSSIPTHSPP